MSGSAAITQSAGAAHTRILGVGAMRPERVVTNEEVCTWIDSSDEWIRERSGIRERRFAEPAATVVDMALPACRDALAMAGISASDVDAVIVSTVTWYLQTPSAAAVPQSRREVSSPASQIPTLYRRAGVEIPTGRWRRERRATGKYNPT